MDFAPYFESGDPGLGCGTDIPVDRRPCVNIDRLALGGEPDTAFRVVCCGGYTGCTRRDPEGRISGAS